MTDEMEVPKKRLSLDNLLTSISLSLKDTILIMTIVLTVVGSAWYYRDKINSLETQVTKLEAADLATRVTVLETTRSSIGDEIDSIYEDLEEFENAIENRVTRNKYRTLVRKVKNTFNNVRQVTLPFVNELERD